MPVETMLKNIHYSYTYSAAKRIDFSWTWYEKMKKAMDELT